MEDFPVRPKLLGEVGVSNREYMRTSMRSVAVEARKLRRGIWITTLLILGLHVGGYGAGWYSYKQILAKGFFPWPPGGAAESGLYARGAMAADYSLVKAPAVMDWPIVVGYTVVLALLLWGMWRSAFAPFRWALGGTATFFGAVVFISWAIYPVSTYLTISGSNHVIVPGTPQARSGQPVELCSLQKISIQSSRPGKSTYYLVEGSEFPAEPTARAQANELVIFNSEILARAFANELDEARRENCRN
ncbi:hypothetical protein [Burkholderia glumae]|uniref:hypothetical protein n=1 Tax=Burkholderia glumae TaxID=337 RepID=UPI000F5E6ADE|nr:hypothetical protein [Burkholderia glumae]MCQ0031304.1 hypothetical protein [Burkholderia glumae]MCQ0036215.1 hypothetical protein [Burkholderia glumae]QJW81488.1 hypothetical protein GAS18_22910 [Burkholderia glumae]